MADFNGIGQAFSDTVAEDFLEDIKRHRPDCPSFTFPYQLCIYCNAPSFNFNDVNYLSSPQNFNSLPNYGAQEQIARPFSPGRTYAQVAGHPSQGAYNAPNTSWTNTSPSNYPQTQAGGLSQTQDFQSIEQWMRTSTVVAASAPTNSMQLTYAQVAQQAAQQAHRNNARIQQAQQPSLRPNQQPNTAPRGTTTAHVPPRGPQISINHAPQQPRSQNREMNLLNICPPMSPPSQYRNTFSSPLPQVEEEMFHMPLRPEANPDPRNVNTLVQRTQRGAHRQSLTPSTPHSSFPTPMSPGTLSDTSFSSARSNRRTGQAQFDPTGNPHRCPTCARTFPTAEAERRHERNAHTEMSNRRHRCDHIGCGKAFTYPKDLVRHLKIHDEGGESYPCPYCGKKYTRADNLNRHMRTEHAESDSGLGTSISMSRSTSNTSYSYN